MISRRHRSVKRRGWDGGGGEPSRTPGKRTLVEETGGGRRLDARQQADAEARLNVPLDDVRIHDDASARQAAAEVEARAFTVGSDIFLGPGSQEADRHLMLHELAHVAQQHGATSAPQASLEVSQQHDPAEREAEAFADRAASEAPRESWIVDDAVTPRVGQLRRSDFLARLRAEATKTANDALGPEWSADACPYIESWFARYAGADPRSIETIVARYSRVTSATSAESYLAPTCARLGEGILRWKRNEDVSGEIAAAGVHASVETAQSELGPSAPLDAATASRMSSALGQDVSGARIHTGEHAARKAASLDAAAFTVGHHVAFAAGEYRPGTIEGDALLAHELAHVGQQADAAATSSARTTSSAPARETDDEAEHDADDAATHAVASIHAGGSSGWRKVMRAIANRVTRPFSLQRCSKPQKEAAKKKAPETAATAPALTEEDIAREQAEAKARDEMGQLAVEKFDEANKPDKKTGKGVWYPSDYRQWRSDPINAANGPAWVPKMADGYTASKAWAVTSHMRFVLRKGHPAADALREWFEGTTIAECATTGCAIYWFSILNRVGDEVFNRNFNTTDEGIVKFVISTNLSVDPLGALMEESESATSSDRGTPNNRPAKVGEWHYFRNSPFMVAKHPNSGLQGENAMYVGRDPDGNQRWSGLGFPRATEDEMLTSFKTAYDQPQTESEARICREKNGDEPCDNFPETISLEDLRDGIARDRSGAIVNDKVTIDGYRVTSGFTPGSGKRLDVGKIDLLK